MSEDELEDQPEDLDDSELDDEDDLEADDEPEAEAEAVEDDDDDTSDSLEELLAQRSASRRGTDDADDDDDIMALASERDPGGAEPIPVRVVPVKAQQEFVCRRCHLVKARSQLADVERMLCRDCV